MVRLGAVQGAPESSKEWGIGMAAVIERLGREPIDGRPLYQYRVEMEHLGGLEVLINHPMATEQQKILALAPVAAARFASNYEDGLPSWADCGPEVERLYGATQVSQARFRTLMELSLGRYRVPIIKGANGAALLLQTIISQAGLPSGMLRQGRVLRGVLDELVKRLALGSDDLQRDASTLILAAFERDALGKAYQEAGHLPKLCADLVAAVVRLTERAAWMGGSLDPLWAVTDWDRELPFRVEERAAREIVGELLGVAIAAAGGGALAVDRILSGHDGEWSLKARAIVPAEGIELADGARPVLSVQYVIGEEPAGEAFRVRRTDGSTYRLARPVEDLLITTANSRVSLAVQDAEGTYRSLECSRGEPLGEGAVWVFEVRNGEYVYKADAPVRLRATELLVALPEGTEMSGQAAAIGRSFVQQGVRRTLWKVTGIAQAMGPDGDPALIQAGYEGPQAYLDFRGKVPPFQTHGFSAVFLGDPVPRRVGALSGRIEWRRPGEQVWNNRPVRGETGHLTFRLISTDGDVLAERRRVFVLPEDFRPAVTNRTISFELPPSFNVQGHTPDPHGNYVLEFGQASNLQLAISTASSELGITFKRTMQASFVNAVTGEEVHAGTRTVSARVADRFLASSLVHDHVEIRRRDDNWASLYLIGLSNGRLHFSDERVSGFLKALSFSPRGRTHALIAQFQNGPALKMDAYRIRKRAGTLTVTDAASDTAIELRSMAPDNDGSFHIVKLNPVDAETWAIPDVLDRAPYYLAIDTAGQAAPCMVPGKLTGQVPGHMFYDTIANQDESAREMAIVELYECMTSNPHDGFLSAEIDTCLKWLGEFQTLLKWLDPFLVLSKNPRLALRILALARLRGEVQAEQGLRWALDEVPFFWHRVTSSELNELMEWALSQFGQEYSEQVRQLVSHDDLRIPSRMMEPRMMRACHPGWLLDWQESVVEWCESTERGYEPRSPRVGDAAATLWRAGEMHPVLAQARCRPPRIPAGVDLFRTYLMAPYELAISISQGVEPEAGLREDLLYARHMIDAAKFDDAYCVALSLLEGDA